MFEKLLEVFSLSTSPYLPRLSFHVKVCIFSLNRWILGVSGTLTRFIFLKPVNTMYLILKNNNKNYYGSILYTP